VFGRIRGDKVMTEEYKLGYADGVSDLRNKLMVEIHDILECEKQSYDNGGESDKNLQGWIECLEMIQNRLRGDE
tara:strand:- start:103 stop:324 length:222 start_codon:yes stop_codon:yes gene_type:complete